MQNAHYKLLVFFSSTVAEKISSLLSNKISEFEKTCKCNNFRALSDNKFVD